MRCVLPAIRNRAFYSPKFSKRVRPIRSEDISYKFNWFGRCTTGKEMDAEDSREYANACHFIAETSHPPWEGVMGEVERTFRAK